MSARPLANPTRAGCGVAPADPAWLECSCCMFRPELKVFRTFRVLCVVLHEPLQSLATLCTAAGMADCFNK